MHVIWWLILLSTYITFLFEKASDPNFSKYINWVIHAGLLALGPFCLIENSMFSKAEVLDLLQCFSWVSGHTLFILKHGWIAMNCFFLAEILWVFLLFYPNCIPFMLKSLCVHLGWPGKLVWSMWKFRTWQNFMMIIGI